VTELIDGFRLLGSEFIHEPRPFVSRSHSLRLGGAVTSIRLENAFWDVLTDMAATKSISLNQLIARVHHDIADHRDGHANMASALRVVCVQWIASETPRQRPIRSPRLTSAL
jgi:predicted DNA-binding ribbon-helix-helix protein